MSVSAPIQQLQDQQSLLTQALRAALEGNWCDAPPSVQAFVSALDPSLQVGCVPPYRQTDIPPAPPDYLANYDPETYMPRQAASWTCSACSLAWVERATGVNPGADEWSAVEEIGQPDNINPTYGLMDGSGSQLRRVLRDIYGQNSNQGWLSYDDAWAIYSQTPGMMSGATWYHWVGVRGTLGGDLWVANSAPGYQGINSIVSRQDYQRLGGFSCVWLTP